MKNRILTIAGVLALVAVVIGATFPNTFVTDPVGKFPALLPVNTSAMQFVGNITGDGTVYGSSLATFTDKLFSFDNLTVTNGFTNSSWTASTVISANAQKKAVSIANGTGALTNNAGLFGWYNNYGTLDGQNNWSGSNYNSSTYQALNLEATAYNVITNRWPGATANLDLTLASQDYTASANCTVSAFANRSTSREQHVELTITNSSGSDVTMTIPNSVMTPDGLRVYTVTNKNTRVFSFKYSPNGYTQMVTQPFF